MIIQMITQIRDRLHFYKVEFKTIGQVNNKLYIFANSKNFFEIEQHLTTYEKQFVNFVSL